MKSLIQYIYEASRTTRIKNSIKQVINKIRAKLGKPEKMFKPYIIIDGCETIDTSDDFSRGIKIISHEALYFKDEMIAFFENLDYENKITYFGKPSYSFSNLDLKDVKKIWDDACKKVDEINTLLGTGKVSLEKYEDKQIKDKNKQLQLFNDKDIFHDTWKTELHTNHDRWSEWKTYEIEMIVDEFGRPCPDKNGYYTYPAIEFVY